MRRTLLAGSLPFLAAAAAAAAQSPRPAGPEPLVSDVRPLTEAPPPFPLVETYLAVDPTDAENLLASAMGTSAERSVVYASGDGGARWRQVDAPDGPVFPGGDPMLAWAGDGRAYFSTITPELSVWRSEDGGRTWAGPVVVGAGLAADRQWVAVSRTPARAPLPVHLAAKTPEDPERPGGRDALILSVSRDGGATFAEPTLIPLDSGYLHSVTDLVVREDGTVLLSYLANYGRVPGPEEVFRGRRWTMLSEDEGASWRGPYPVAENLQYGNRSWERAMKGLGGGGVALDESGGAHHGTVYMTWAAVADEHLQIVLARSRDGGRSWEPPVRVNDGGFDSDHSTPTVAVNDEGVVVVTWNDRRDDPDDLCFVHYVAASVDGGRSFGPNRPVSDGRTCPGARSRWLNGGDTQGLAALPDGSFRTVWSVGADGDLRPWTAVIRVR